MARHGPPWPFSEIERYQAKIEHIRHEPILRRNRQTQPLAGVESRFSLPVRPNETGSTQTSPSGRGDHFCPSRHNLPISTLSHGVARVDLTQSIWLTKPPKARDKSHFHADHIRGLRPTGGASAPKLCQARRGCHRLSILIGMPKNDVQDAGWASRTRHHSASLHDTTSVESEIWHIVSLRYGFLSRKACRSMPNQH